jgi:DNA-binding NtrC family response regulator
MELLVGYNWPGNVRELENCLETTVILNREDVLLPDHFHFLEEHRDLLVEEGTVQTGEMSLAEGEKRLILSTFRKKGENKTHTAKALGITIKTLRTKLREYGVLNGKE